MQNEVAIKSAINLNSQNFIRRAYVQTKFGMLPQFCPVSENGTKLLMLLLLLLFSFLFFFIKSSKMNLKFLSTEVSIKYFINIILYLECTSKHCMSRYIWLLLSTEDSNSFFTSTLFVNCVVVVCVWKGRGVGYGVWCLFCLFCLFCFWFCLFFILFFVPENHLNLIFLQQFWLRY